MLQRFRSGQALAEYAFIAMLVALAIMVGGPFLKRSIFGFFKAQEDSVLDSFTEEMRQEAGEPTIQVCSCGSNPDTDGTWTTPNPARCGMDGCDLTQSSYIRDCSPMLCKRQQKCVGDVTCCSPATGVQKVGCGTLVSAVANSPRHLSGNYDIIHPTSPCPNPITTATPPCRKAASGRFTARLSQVTPAIEATIDGTIYVNGVDTRDCLVGERIISITCGIPPITPTPPALPDLKDEGTSEELFACEKGYTGSTTVVKECLPLCLTLNGLPSVGSACNTTPNPYGEFDPRAGLLDEVIYRKNNGVFQNARSIFIPDPLRRGLEASTRVDYSSWHSPAEIQAFPYYDPGNHPYIDASVYLGAWVLPLSYLPDSSHCKPERKCEFTCPAGAIPSPDGTYCARPACRDTINSTRVIAGDIRKPNTAAGQSRLTFITPKLATDSNIYFSLISDNMNYGVACFDFNGNIKTTLGNIPISSVPCTAPCNPDPFLIMDKTLYFNEPASTSLPPYYTDTIAVPETKQINCSGQLAALRLFNPVPFQDLGSNNIMSYDIRYAMPVTSAELSVLADNLVTIYQSNGGYNQGKLLFTTTPYAANFVYPYSGFTADAGLDGKIHLKVELTNKQAGSATGISIKQKLSTTSAGCFNQQLPITAPTPTLNVGNQVPGTWYESGCWRGFNSANEVVYTLDMVSDLDAPATCNFPTNLCLCPSATPGNPPTPCNCSTLTPAQVCFNGLCCNPVTHCNGVDGIAGSSLAWGDDRCGDNRCGGTCPRTCIAGTHCDGTGVCAAGSCPAYNCTGKTCGADGCGQSCAPGCTAPGEVCTSAGTCCLQTLINEGFESIAVPTGSYGTTNSFPPWNVSQLLEIQNNIVGPPNSGNNHAELDALIPGSLSQTITTSPGVQYTLTYFNRARSDALTENAINVSWNGIIIRTLNSQSASWTQYTDFVTGTGTDTLAFRDISSSNGSGGLLDDIRLTRICP